ncbi:Thioredoxin-like protein, partial [Globisporangium splendens]
MATKFKDLADSFSRSECYCLNENPNHPFGNLFVGDGTLQLKSDADGTTLADELLCLNVGDYFAETAPRVVKLFANRTSLGFSDAGDIEPTQTIELTDEDLEPNKEIELRFVKFQRVKSVTIFVEENNGAEETVISGLKLFGERIAGTNMNDLKKISDE